MCNPRAPARARAVLFVAALISGLAGLAPSVSAEEKFQRLFVFGDSYTDTALAGLWRVYPLPLQENLGIPQMVEFGVGGARASPIGPPAVVPPGWHLKQQVDAYLGTNDPIGTRDLVTLNIGGNDGLGIVGNILTPANNAFIGYPAISMNVANAATFANQTADYATAEIQRLIGAGARNFVLGEFSGLSGLPVVPAAVGPIADAYGLAYFNAMQARLAPLGQAGIRFFMLDLFRLGNAVNADPAKYGFVGFNCPGGPPVCGGSINSPKQTQYYLGPDGLHLTSGGFALVADYMASIVMAPDTIAVQPGIVTSTASNFTSSVLGRLDAIREQGGISGFDTSSGDGPMGLGRGSERGSGQIGASSRLTAFTLGTFAGGNNSGSSGLVGFDHEATSGTVGLEYRVNANLRVGLAGNFTSTGANLDNHASIDLDALQAAAYLSYTARHWFGDALVAIGHHDLDLARPGVIDTVRGNTDALSFAAAAKGGYLFDFGRLRAGPIAGLTYVHSRVDGYTETGDPLLTFAVGAQTLETITGNVGIQFRAPFLAGRSMVSPFLNVTLEHQFGDNTRTLSASLTQAPIVPILTPVSNFDARTYGRVEGGVVFEIGPNVSATINASSTFARDDNDYRISTGVNYRF